MPEDEKIVSAVDEKVEPTEEEKTVAEETKKETEEAVRLYRALNGDNGVKVLEILAREAGLNLDSTKVSAAEKKDAIMDMLEENLGPQYKFLAPKLGPVLKQLLQESKSETERRFSELTNRDLEKETDSALTDVMKDHTDFHLFAKDIQKLMEEIAPAKGISQKIYLNRLYRLAKQEAEEKGTEQKRAERLSRAANDIHRVAPVGGSDRSHVDKNRPLSLRAAISETLEELSTAEDK